MGGPITAGMHSAVHSVGGKETKSLSMTCVVMMKDIP